MHSMQGYADAWIVCEESCGQCIVCMGMQVHGSCGEESCGQCIVCSGMHIGNGQECVGTDEEDTVSNDDENERIPEAHESPKGSLAPQGRA